MKSPALTTHLTNTYARLSGWFLLYILLTTAASFKLLGKDLDYFNYYSHLHLFGAANTDSKEIAFFTIRYITREFFESSLFALLLIYASIGVFVKLYSIHKYSPLPLLSVFIYLCTYYPLHEYTQIRAGVASGFFLLAIYDIHKGKPYQYYSKILIAVLFHWSAAYALIFYPLFRFIPLRLLLLLPLAGLVLYSAKEITATLVEALMQTNQNLNQYYTNHSGHTEKFNTLNIPLLINLFVWGATLIMAPKHKLYQNTFFSTLFFIFSLSIFTYLTLSTLERPVVSFRLYEFMNVALILLLPQIAFLFKQKALPILLIIIYSLLNLYHLIANVNLFPEL